jgi:HAD superfamily hydrolase (TIGR01509 family)
MIRAVIFDLDGVLADSEPWWNQIDAKLLSEHGVTYRGECHQDVVGVSYPIAVEFYKKTFGIKAPAEQMMKRRGKIAAEFFADRVDPFPGAKEILQHLRQLKLHREPPVRLGLATSSVSTSARPFLDRHQLTQFFDVVVTGDEVERGKPAPDIYLRAAEKLNLPSDKCLVVEDALAGIAAAKAAKMPVVAIPDRRFVDPAAYEKQADYILSNLNELPSLVQKLLGVD